jgi:hypothetical protein
VASIGVADGTIHDAIGPRGSAIELTEGDRIRAAAIATELNAIL